MTSHGQQFKVIGDSASSVCQIHQAKPIGRKPKAERRMLIERWQTLIIFPGSASECITVTMLLCNYLIAYPSKKFGILLIITYLD